MRDLRRLRGERGQGMVEFALVLPILLILLGGILDFGWMFNGIISVRQGTRDGARQAAVGKFGTSTSCTLTGFSGGTTANQLFCLTKGRDDASGPDTRLQLIVGVPSSNCNAGTYGLPTSCYRVGQPLVLCQQYKTRSLTGILPVLTGKVHTTRTVVRIETLNMSGLASASESSLNASPINCPEAPIP